MDNSFEKMSSKIFKSYGELCALYPWEVIFTTVTMTTCIFTIDRNQSTKEETLIKNCDNQKNCNHELEYNAANVIIMTIVRCVAILYSYYQLRNLKKLDCKYILIISGLFTVGSSFIFSSVAIHFLDIEISDLKDAIFFFLLLIDLSKISILAQYALSSKNQDDIRTNIAKGMSILGPNITLDTLVETLLLSVGTLSGVQSLEKLSYFACLSVIVNYIVFMTFFPSCLCLILELSQYYSNKEKMFTDIVNKEDIKINPVVQRVKIIMSIGLAVVHLHIRLNSIDTDVQPNQNIEVFNCTETKNETKSFGELVLKWLTLSCDHIVILILVVALTVKFIFFEDTTELEQLKSSKEISKPEKLIEHELLLNTEKIQSCDKGVQTFYDLKPIIDEKPRDLKRCQEIFKRTNSAESLSNKEIIMLVKNKSISSYQLEKVVDNPNRGIDIRRKLIEEKVKGVEKIPFEGYDFSKVIGTCCENIIGYVPLPVGIVGPLKIDEAQFYVPMATTEGCLVASTNRGARALINGVTTRIVSDGMTRAPVVKFPTVSEASEALKWMEGDVNFKNLKENFDSTSRFAKLIKIQPKIAGRYLFIRFVAKTGDAMGMNMISKGTEYALNYIKMHFPSMEILSLSGNFCTDKKPSAINWIEGRGKGVVAEAIIPSDIIEKVLKTNVGALIEVNISKNLVGSAISGSIGGFNAHAANIVTAIYIATGQDPAQNVTSSNCITLMEPHGDSGLDLYITCTMPSLEVGTVGGGTILPGQAASLEMLGVKGSNVENPGENANKLAKIVCATVLAGELSLMSALASGDLVKSHLKYNRINK